MEHSIQGRQVGAWFTGRNEPLTRTRQTSLQVVAAQRGRDIVWIVRGSLVSTNSRSVR